MDKFVPKEPGPHWWSSEFCLPVVVNVTRAANGDLFVDQHGVEHSYPLSTFLGNGTFHEGPIQPPEEGRG